MKGIMGVVIGALLVIVIIMGVVWSQNNNNQAKKGGALYIGITDATADISNVNDIEMNVNKVELYNNMSGWVTASDSDKSYQLMKLHSEGKTELYAKVNVPANNYEKVRVTLGKVVVKTKNRGDVEASLPSHYIVANTTVAVKDNSDAVVKLDVLADKSIHTTNDGKYVFAAVVNSESKANADVSVNNDDSMVVTGGSVTASGSVGVDIDGTSKSNFALTTDNSLKVDTTAVGGLKLMLGGKTYSESDNQNTDAKVKDGADMNAGNSDGLKNSINGEVSLPVDIDAGVNANGKLKLSE